MRSKPAGRTMGQKRIIADGCYVLLKTLGWSVVTAACVVATYMLLFLMLGHFSLPGLLVQFDNLATRYLEAGQARQLLLERQLLASSLLLFAIIGFFRRASLLPFIPKETQDGLIT
jgi:hypothetical protein